MDMKGYVDEVKLRLSRLDTAIKLDDPLIATYINRARREVQRMSIAIMPERYGKVQTAFILPTYYEQAELLTTYSGTAARMLKIGLNDEFIEPVVVILQYTMSTGQSNAGVTFRSEARRMTKQEMYSIQKHAWNSPVDGRPVYSVERPLDGTNQSWVLYLSGLDLSDGNTLFDVAEALVLEVWYVSALNDLEFYNPTVASNTDEEQTIPPELEELVVYYAMAYCLRNINMAQAFPSVEADIRMFEDTLKLNYQVDKIQNSIMLPSKEEG